jgi:hypothetical protein
MTSEELQQERRRKWRLDGQPIRTVEEAAEFIESAGFCLLYPERPPVLAPTFLGACVGDDFGLPRAPRVFADPRAQAARDLMLPLLRRKAAFEANLFGENPLLVAATVFPYFYALAGDRTPRRIFRPGGRNPYSELASDVFAAVNQHGPVNKARLRDWLGGGPSDQALDRALGELWSRLRITRVDYRPGEGAYWDVLSRWAPEAVRAGANLSQLEALSALVSKYVDCVIAAEPAEIAGFLSPIVARSKVQETVNALLAARELVFVPVGDTSRLQLA